MPRVLVVDDEPVILQILRAVLAEEPWDCIFAGSGREGLAALEAGGVDCLLTDKNMPDLSGLELARVARAQGAEVLVMTGYASVETAVRAVELGVFDYIVKPFEDIFAVRRKVGQALERRRLQAENAALVEGLRARTAALEAALAEARALQSELVQAEKLAGLGTLAAGLAHEISSPLMGVMGLCEAITVEDDAALCRAHAAEAVVYCGAIRDIVQGLTRHARSAEADPPGRVDVGAVAREAVRLCARLAPEVQFVVEVPPGVAVHGRAGEVQQVLVNLLRNGADAVMERGGGRVGVGARVVDGGLVAVDVADDGAGIAPADLPRVFEPFFTTKAPGRGTGLGLAVTWRIVQRLGGRVSVDSAPGEGTTVHLLLPAGDG